MKLLNIFMCCVFGYSVNALNLPGPLVYVVTPSPRPPNVNEARSRSAPFYYNNWMRRMDAPLNITTTTTPKTPDLIFAEFESDKGDNMRKSIRKLLEKERIEIEPSTTSTAKPIYVAHDEPNNIPPEITYGEPSNEKGNVAKEPESNKPVDMTDYFALYNNLYGDQNQAPVYLPSTTPSTTTTSTTTVRPTTTTPEPMKVENIWHIIDNEKYNNHVSGNWEEIPVETEDQNKDKSSSNSRVKLPENPEIDENFALPGFSTNPGNGAENESRAIRTEQNNRFPYVNLKPFLMKHSKNPLPNSLQNSKKGNNMFTNLDNFYDMKNPVRGEAEDVMHMISQPIDRYNPAQPYLPSPEYGSKSKQSSPSSPPVKAVANLVPPPPPVPKVTADDFPAPTSYESFPPYAPTSGQAFGSPQSNGPPVSLYRPPQIQQSFPVSIDSDSPPSDDSDDGPPMDVGYRYKPPVPAPKPPAFVPTLPPIMKPMKGYSYDKPVMMAPPPPMDTNMNDNSDFQGYHYSKPESPEPPMEHGPPASYGHHDHQDHYDHHPSYEPDYPEVVFNKPHGGKDTKGSDDDMGMSPPAAPNMKPDMSDDMPPPEDSGFPHDFPGDFKYHHDFDDHHVYHEHHTTTTTTTTEMPRVNRYSYYYLGKKLYYLPLYFSVYFIIYVGALIIKAVLRHKITYPNSWRPNDQTASFFSKRSVDSWDLSSEQLHHITGKVTKAIAGAAAKYMDKNKSE